MAEQLRAPDCSPGVSDQQSVGLSPGQDTCVLKKHTEPLLVRPFGLDVKLLLDLCVV